MPKTIPNSYTIGESKFVFTMLPLTQWGPKDIKSFIELKEENDQASLELFGEDSKCPNWEPTKMVFGPASSFYSLVEATSDAALNESRLVCLCSYLHVHLYVTLVYWMSETNFKMVAQYLYNPSLASGRTKIRAALVRKEVIWPLFKSTEAFWSALWSLYERFQGKVPKWPKGEADLKLIQVQDELEEAGWEEEAKLAEALMAICGDEGANFCANALHGLEGLLVAE